MENPNVLRSNSVGNKYELIIVAAREARRLNELSRQTGLNLGAKVTNVALEEALKGNVLYRYGSPDDQDEVKEEAPAESSPERVPRGDARDVRDHPIQAPRAPRGPGRILLPPADPAIGALPRLEGATDRNRWYH